MSRCLASVMPEVLIIADPTSPSSQALNTPSIATEMKRAILDTDGGDSQVRLVLTTELDLLKKNTSSNWSTGLVCSLTFNLPDWLPIPNQAIYSACADVHNLRQTVGQWNYAVGEGTHWLPIVWTAKGPLYGEAIVQLNDRNQVDEPIYQQPLHLVDAQRQPLYRLGQRLLTTLEALPGVYLMQFGATEDTVWFDRLIPFPDLPAIASLGVQTPDLFVCHWRSLTNRPMQDLVVSKP